MQKNLKLIIGCILIFIGAGYLLRFANINIISFAGFWDSLGLTWPLLLVVVGIYFVTDAKFIRNASVALFILALLAGTVYYSMTVDKNIFNNHNDNRDRSVFDYGDEYDNFNFFDF